VSTVERSLAQKRREQDVRVGPKGPAPEPAQLSGWCGEAQGALLAV
jgi:hypothetical protein